MTTKLTMNRSAAEGHEQNVRVSWDSVSHMMEQMFPDVWVVTVSVSV